MPDYIDGNVDGQSYRAYQQKGSLSCGPASLVNAIYYLTGNLADEGTFRHDTGVQMTTKPIDAAIRKLKFGKQGLRLLKKFDAFEDSAVYKANNNLRPTMGQNNHFAFLYNADEMNDCADIADLQKSIKKYGLHSTSGAHIAPNAAVSRAKAAFSLNSAKRCFVMGVKWTDTIDDEGGGHWIAVVGKRNDGSLIVLDSEAGVVIADRAPAYSQGDAGERGFFDGYFIEIWGG